MAERRRSVPRRARGSALLPLLLAGCVVPSPEPAEVAVEMPASAPAEAAPGEVPFTFEGPGGGALVVPVLLNGEGPFDFVVDTGATLTCVDRALADRLELAEERGVRAVGAGVGTSGRLALVRLDSLRLGEATARDLMACAIDLRQAEALGLEVDGLLGLNFLKVYRVTFDFEREVLLLESP